MKAAITLIQNISYKERRNHVYVRCQSIFGILAIVRRADSKGLSASILINLRGNRLITKILVGVDGSENSEKTLDCALEIDTELKEGYAPSQIVEAAAEGQFGLIVLGHRGDSQIKELFLRSTSKRVAHQATCPVLITK